MIRDRIRSRYAINSEADRRMENIKGFSKNKLGIGKYREDTIKGLRDKRIDLLEKKVEDKANSLINKYRSDIKKIERYYNEIKKNDDLFNYMWEKDLIFDMSEGPYDRSVSIAYDYYNNDAFRGLYLVNDDGQLILDSDNLNVWRFFDDHMDGLFDDYRANYDSVQDALKDIKKNYDEDDYYKFLMYINNHLNVAEIEIPKFIKKFYDTLDSLEDNAIESSFRKRC